MFTLLFGVLADVLSRPPYGLSTTTLAWASDSPCFVKLDPSGEADVFAVQVHRDSAGRRLIYSEAVEGLCAHYRFDLATLFRKVRTAGGESLDP